MRTCTIKSVYETICWARGWDPAVAAVSAGEMARIALMVTERLQEAWEHAFWPDILTVEQRQYRATWDATLNYAAGAEVYHVDAEGAGGYWVSLQDGNVGKDPDTETTWWAAVGADFQRTIEFQQEDETEIGAVDVEDCCFDVDPRIYRDAGAVRPVILVPGALQVTADEAPVRPWIRFRTPAPVFSLTEWGATTAYAVGDVAYLAATGDCYVALQASTGRHPDAETAYWMPVQFPVLFRKWVRHAVHGEWLLDPVERARELNLAAAEMERLEDTLVDQTGSRRGVVFSR